MKSTILIYQTTFDKNIYIKYFVINAKIKII